MDYIFSSFQADAYINQHIPPKSEEFLTSHYIAQMANAILLLTSEIFLSEDLLGGSVLYWFWFGL